MITESAGAEAAALQAAAAQAGDTETDGGVPAALAALRRAGDWLLGMQVRAGVFRVSSAHDPAAWPGPLLHGTYDAVMALGLLDRLDAIDSDATAGFILDHRTADGSFWVAQMVPDQIFKKPDVEETRRYIAFHLTNYSLGALQRLGRLEPAALGFLEPFLDVTWTEAWLARRDLRDPWQEGNNVVNLGSFLLLAQAQGEARAGPVLDAVMAWHDRLQEPATGFWGVGQSVDRRSTLHALAGATHNLHLFYALKRPIPHAARMIDTCLSFPTGADTACIDVDLIDILVHLRDRMGYRRAEIDLWLAGKLDALLAVQNPDGGFPDEGWAGVLAGTRRLDGWVGGYAEPQGLSNTFATNFRTIAIAMILTALWPDQVRFAFRGMVGIGYADPLLGHPSS